jgi:hypothetical protein
MTREEMYQRLAKIRQELRQMRRETDSPAVSNALREMDVYCFEALEYLGEPEELFPEEVL